MEPASHPASTLILQSWLQVPKCILATSGLHLFLTVSKKMCKIITIMFKNAIFKPQSQQGKSHRNDLSENA